MKDDVSPLKGWDYHEYIRFAPKATNNVIGSFFFFLRDMLLCFCKRIKDINIYFRLFNIDARELPDHLSIEESQFDYIEVDITKRFLLVLELSKILGGFRYNVYSYLILSRP
jgi:hypothetical protein